MSDSAQIEILAFMKQKGMPAPRSFQRKPGAPNRWTKPNGAAPRRVDPPPRGRDDARDAKCANCGRKGHKTAECRQERVPFDKRKCFNCDKTGHNAANCPTKMMTTEEQPAALPVKAVTTSEPALRSVMCCQWYNGPPCEDEDCDDDGCVNDGCAASPSEPVVGEQVVTGSTNEVESQFCKVPRRKAAKPQQQMWS